MKNEYSGTDFPGRDGGTGKRSKKSSPHGLIKGGNEGPTAMVRGKHDKHPMKAGHSNRA